MLQTGTVLAGLGKFLADLGQNNRQDGFNSPWRSPSPVSSFPTYDGFAIVSQTLAACLFPRIFLHICIYRNPDHRPLLSKILNDIICSQVSLTCEQQRGCALKHTVLIPNRNLLELDVVDPNPNAICNDLLCKWRMIVPSESSRTRNP